MRGWSDRVRNRTRGSLHYSLGCGLIAVLLLSAAPAGARCVTPVPTVACDALTGVKVLGLLVEIREGASALGVSKARLTEAARRMVRGFMPHVRIDPDPRQAPQIHIVASRLRHKGSVSSIYLQVEVREIDVGTQSLSWKSVWHTSYVIPARAGIEMAYLEQPLRVSLTRLRAEWHRANPGLSSRTEVLRR